MKNRKKAPKSRMAPDQKAEVVMKYIKGNIVYMKWLMKQIIDKAV